MTAPADEADAPPSAKRRGIYTAAFILVALIGVVRVASTHRVFSEILDEPAHLACGYDWLAGRPYSVDSSHPPLARVLSAIPAFSAGIRIPDQGSFIERGNLILYHGDRYVKNLARARIGNLLFLLAGMIAAALWARRYFGPFESLMSAAMFVSLPPILGHAGVATTDAASAATVPLALLALETWLDDPAPKRSFLFGLAMAVGLLSKFSFIVYFAVSAAAIIAVRGKRRELTISARGAGIALAVAILLVWAGYKFEFGTLEKGHPEGVMVLVNAAPERFRPMAEWFARHVPLPAPEFFVGIGQVKIHDDAGHRAYLFGQVSDTGWWYYFPVLFFYKTPLPFLILAVAGIAWIVARRREALPLVVAPLAVLLYATSASINIGVRHILPIYAPLCAAAAAGAIVLWRSARTQIASIALMAWLFVGIALAHPDYLAWFNEAAGEYPERIAIDSNLDWGQDVLRLAKEVRARRIEHLRVLYFGNAPLQNHGIRAEALIPWVQAPGWYALSLSPLHMDSTAREGAYRWLDQYRSTMVGRSIRLVRVPEPIPTPTPAVSGQPKPCP